MNKNAVITTAAVFAGITAIDYVNKTRKQRKAREELLKFQKNINALLSANEQVLTNIENGEYQGKTYDDILTDYEFYKLIANPKI